jgi:uncharacterized 2Fe-2S/4Fe-4S cluster protein (DUF4445 family)
MGRIIVMPERMSGSLREGDTLLSHIQRLGIHITVGCGGTGECGTCRVRILSGAGGLSPLTSQEIKWSVTSGERLACQAVVFNESDNITVEIPKTSSFSILGEGIQAKFVKDPMFHVRKMDGRRVVFRDDEVVGFPKGWCTGISFDIGTTTLVIRWYNLEGDDINPCATVSVLNPQGRFGDNVISRIGFASSSPDGRKRMEQVLRDGMQKILLEGPVRPEEIYDIVVVGNTVMRDLFCGFPVQNLGQFPYVSSHPGEYGIPASDLKIRINSAGTLYAPPVLGHFVGPDMLAVLLAVGMHEREDFTMAIDIGTNTEIAVGNKEKILVTSCASGPAFEGSGIKCGTGAVNGAIQQVIMQPDGSVSYNTIGNFPPVGICGSGLVDILSGLLEHGFMDERGKLTAGKNPFILVPRDGKQGSGVYLDEEDIDAIKLAKAAVFTGVETVLKRWGITPHQISRLYLAGAFGTSIDPVSAERIGLIPPLPRNRVVQAGNAAIEGASMMLLSRSKRIEAGKIAEITEHISLENEPGFEDMYIEGLRFGTVERI